MSDFKISAATAEKIAALRTKAELQKQVHDTFIRGVLAGAGYDDVELSKVNIDFAENKISVSD